MSETNNLLDSLLLQDSALDLPLEDKVEPLTVKLEEIKQESTEDIEEVSPLYVQVKDIKNEVPTSYPIAEPGCSKWEDRLTAGPSLKVKQEVLVGECSSSSRLVGSNKIKSEPPDPHFKQEISSSEEDEEGDLSLPDDENSLDTGEMSSIKSETDDIEMKTEEELKQEEVMLDDNSSGVQNSVLSQRPTITSLDNPPAFKRKVGIHINYKCEICGYQTRFKPHYRSHLLKHKKPEEIDWHQCPLCSHKTKTKANLNTHLGTHKATDKIYRCTECEYKTKYRKTFNRHLLDHGIVKVDRFECPYCDYETPNKYTLEMHVVIHKDETETDIFYCPHCPYKGKRKRDLRIHSIRHKSTDEIKMFKCPDCEYHTKRKADLKSHALKHKTSDQVDILQCPFCDYHTKYKNAFKTHMGRHQNPDEVKLFYCDNCEYRTRFKNYLKKHRFFKHKIEEPQFHKVTETEEQHLIEPQLSPMFKEPHGIDSRISKITKKAQFVDPQFIKIEKPQLEGS